MCVCVFSFKDLVIYNNHSPKILCFLRYEHETEWQRDRGGCHMTKILDVKKGRVGPLHFLFDFNRNYASILYRFRIIASYLLKVIHFNLPHLHVDDDGNNSQYFQNPHLFWCPVSITKETT